MLAVTRNALAAALGIALLASALAGCTATAPAPSTPTATPAHPLRLDIVTDDHATDPSGKQILHFAAVVKQLSHGAIVVHPQWHAAGDVSDWDQANAQLVTSGKDALGLIPSRAWDELGVTSLRALNTPFLITTTPALNAVVSSAAAKPMLAGLTKASVVGVDMFPEGLRHPFGQDKPLLAAADYRGGVIRTPTSATVKAMFAALGATITDDDLTPADRGAESSYTLTPGGTATGNVVFSPKVNVLVAGSATWGKLTADQQRVLTKAAATTRSWVVSTFPDDRVEAKTYCTGGGTIVGASAADIAGLKQATKGVTADLEKDATTKSIIASIRSTIAALPAEAAAPPVSCAQAQQ